MPAPLPSDDDLLRDSDIDTLRAGTKGGQRANKVETGIRMHHRPTGITVVSRTSRSQFRNRALALQELKRRIHERNKPVKVRKRTQPTRGSKRRRIEAKKRRAETKKLRRPPDV